MTKWGAYGVFFSPRANLTSDRMITRELKISDEFYSHLIVEAYRVTMNYTFRVQKIGRPDW